MTSELWAPRARLCAMPVKRFAYTKLLTRLRLIPTIGFDPMSSGLWAQRATPAPCRFGTSWWFWSIDTWVMSPALCLWAKEVFPIMSFDLISSSKLTLGNLPGPLWGYCLHQDIHLAKTKIPATGFDPVTSELWAPRACLCAMPVKYVSRYILFLHIYKFLLSNFFTH